MTAADDARDALEAVIWRERTAHTQCRNPGPCQFCTAGVEVILAAADRYASAVATRELDLMYRSIPPAAGRPSISPVPDPPVRIGRPT